MCHGLEPEAIKAPSEINAGLSISRLEMRPRIASGADICSIAMLLEACAISAAPPITLNAMASAYDWLSATAMIEAAITMTQIAWISPCRSARPSALAMKPRRLAISVRAWLRSNGRPIGTVIRTSLSGLT
mgnify:CR=1 FL=1